MNQELVVVDGLNVSFHLKGRVVRPVSDVSVRINRDETLAIVGESGSGKSVLVRSIMGLVGAGKTTVRSGSIRFDGTEMTEMSKKELRDLWGSRIGMVMQDPMSSLNPVRRIGIQLTETIRRHNSSVSRSDAREQAVSLLTSVGIADSEALVTMYPHQLSGGMRQRVMIAIAIAGDVDLMVADEPTTALDVSVQNQILNLLAWHRKQRGMAMMLVTHDLAIAAGRADRIIVMYAGEVVESAPTRELFANVKMPYTKALLDAAPRLKDPSGTPVHGIPGQPPNLSADLQGCRFAARCPAAQDKCRTEHPPLEATESGHLYRCWFPIEAAESLQSPRSVELQEG